MSSEDRERLGSGKGAIALETDNGYTIPLIHRKVGTKHVYTSPAVPQLHVSHADQKTAREAVQSALEMFDRMALRRQSVGDR